MRPFEISPALEHLCELYPSAEAVLLAARDGDRDARYAMARLWLSEGIPHCFRSRPALYDSLRRWLARRLDVHAKEITLVGSGRQGFCLSCGVDFGRPFGEHSDLDLTIVSIALFQRLEAAFERWKADYAGGSVTARHKRERAFWDSNKRSVPSGLRRGFIDPHKIPTWDRYPEAKLVGQVMYEAHEKLKATRDGPVVSKLSVRIYRDWDSFVRQMAINLECAASVASETQSG